MFGIFRKKPVLSFEDTEFQVATFKWLLRNFGGKDFFENTKLILPTREYFPSKLDSEDEAALQTFETVKKYAGMEDWPCRLEKQEEDVDARVAPTVAVQNAPSGPLGTFQAKEESEIVITYNPDVVRNPTQLVATYAHELAHYLTGCGQEPPPGGWDNWEFATDIAATFLGFGVFMANSAFNFQQYSDVDSQGWKFSRSGYLSEAEHVFALAIFFALHDMQVDSALPHLKPSLKKLLKRSANQISKTGLVDELMAVKYVPPAYDRVDAGI